MQGILDIGSKVVVLNEAENRSRRSSGLALREFVASEGYDCCGNAENLHRGGREGERGQDSQAVNGKESFSIVLAFHLTRIEN